MNSNINRNTQNNTANAPNNDNILPLIDLIIHKLYSTSQNDVMLKASKDLLTINQIILPKQIETLPKQINKLKDEIKEILQNNQIDPIINAASVMKPASDVENPNEGIEASKEVQEAMNRTLEENKKLLLQYNTELVAANAKKKNMKQSITYFNDFTDAHNKEKQKFLEDADTLIMKLELVKRRVESNQQEDSLLQFEIQEIMDLKDIDAIKKLDSNLYKNVKDLKNEDKLIKK